MIVAVVGGTAAAQGTAEPCPGIERAVELFNAGREDEAYPLLSELSESGCGQSVVYLYQGAYERRNGQPDRAAATFRQGLAHEASNPQLLLELAVTYSWTDRLPEALATYEAALRLDPASTPARLGRARVAGWMGRRREAAEAFEAVLLDQPDNTEALGGLAAVHLAALRPDLAKAYYRRVLALEPDNADALDGLRRAEAVKRLEWSAAMVSDLSSERAVRAFGLSMWYQATPDVRLAAGYNTATRDPVLEQYDSRLRGRAIPVASGLDAGLGWRVTRLSTLNVSYQIQAVPGDTIRSTSVQTSRHVRRHAAVLGGVRTTTSTTGGSLLLASTGISFAPSAGTTTVVQVFHGASSTGRSTALAGTLNLPVWYGCSTSATMAVGRERGATVTLSGAAACRLGAGATVRVEGTAYQGQFSRRRVALTLAARF